MNVYSIARSQYYRGVDAEPIQANRPFVAGDTHNLDHARANNHLEAKTMQTIIEAVLQAGRSAVDIALYTLLPIMLVMMVLMRFLHGAGVIDRAVRIMEPALSPFGLNGLSVLVMIQISLVSFAAPLPTLTLMEDRGTSNRRLAAALAAVLAMAPANATFPMAAIGVNAGLTVLLSVIGGLVASSCCFYVFGRKLSADPLEPNAIEKRATTKPSILKTIEIGGSEAMLVVLRVIPMLLLSLFVVYSAQSAGVINILKTVLAPLFSFLGLSTDLILPIITKYLAGSTALVGLYTDLDRSGTVSSILTSDSTIGFLLHPFDLPGIAILLSAGPRIARCALPALVSALVGIGIRSALGFVVA
ncbi:nucleoside recognition domain-containing protein [Agrobacterium sp. NPDC090273]|uniref:nucleoside recognition domain-containing protein n=1 Tax=Agrobacterium sp. NPDC090273 TaxID=3363919 RepID=UPI00383B74AE